MKKLIVLGLAGLLSLPMFTSAQTRRKSTAKKKTTTTQAKSTTRNAGAEKARAEEAERQRKAQEEDLKSQQLKEASLQANASDRPIPPSDVMYKKTVWRSLDLREKQNRPMFSPGKEITKLIINAVKRGELQPYSTDSLATPLSRSEFTKRLVPDGSAPAPAVGGFEEKPADDAWGAAAAKSDDGWGSTAAADDGWGTPAPKKKSTKAKSTAAAPSPAAAPATDTYEVFPNQLYKVELKEDVIFDKKRSRLYHDIQALTLVMPAKYSGELGIEKPIASFKYSELAKLFRTHTDEAIWFNQQNDAQHKNLADAFDLWLFSSYITKVSNVNDAALADTYGAGKKGLLAAQQAMEDIIEYEYSLWSY